MKKRAHAVRGSCILLGVTGGIAAYKAAYLVRELTRAGASVRVVMTRSAAEFITPLTFSALSNSPVGLDLWSKDQSTGTAIGTRHIDLATWCDLMLIAPASANTIAKLAHGYSDNLLTVLALACRKRVVVAPTMDADMYVNEATQRNLAVLRDRGYDVIPPDVGEHASGLKGPGRLPEVESVVAAVEKVLTGADQDLAGKKVVVSAGPTYEAIDPVRYIGNHSSGKMGFAVAREAARRGATVTLVTGPVALETPRHVKRIDVVSARDMLKALRASVRGCHALIMAAAVADYAPAAASKKKLKKTGSAMTIDLQETPDVLASLAPALRTVKAKVGFALETDNALANARAKLRAKSLDMIVLNELNASNRAFGADTNAVTIINASGRSKRYPSRQKADVARIIIDTVRELL